MIWFIFRIGRSLGDKAFCLKLKIFLHFLSGALPSWQMGGRVAGPKEWKYSGTCPKLICSIKVYDVILCGVSVAIPKQTMICCWAEWPLLCSRDTIKAPVSIGETFGTSLSSSQSEARLKRSAIQKWIVSAYVCGGQRDEGPQGQGEHRTFGIYACWRVPYVI